MSAALGGHLQTFFTDYLTTQRNVSPHTVLAYRDGLKLLLQFAIGHLSKPIEMIEVGDLGVDLVLAFLDHLERGRKNSVATRNARLAALHVFYRHVAVRDPECLELCQRVLAIPTKRAQRRGVDYLEREELDAMIEQIDRSKPAGRRDYALVAFAYQTGARVAEILSLRPCDLQLEVLPQVRIRGKGRKERVLPLWERTATLLRVWLEERNLDPRSTAPVFVNMRGGPLTRWGVRYILRRYARTAAAACPTVAAKPIHPHVLRHTTAVHMLDAGADTSAIRDVLGHESSETTWRYTRLRMETKRKTMESCSPREGAGPVPVWRRDPDLLAQLEAIGRRSDHIEPRRPTPKVTPSPDPGGRASARAPAPQRARGSSPPRARRRSTGH